VKSSDQVDQRRLADARMSDEADRLAGLYFEVDLLEHRFVRLVSKGDVFEDDPAGDLVMHRLLAVAHVGVEVDHLKDSLRRRHRLGKPPGKEADVTKRTVKHRSVLAKLQQLTKAHQVAEHQLTAVIEHDEVAQSQE